MHPIRPFPVAVPRLEPENIIINQTNIPAWARAQAYPSSSIRFFIIIIIIIRPASCRLLHSTSESKRGWMGSRHSASPHHIHILVGLRKQATASIWQYSIGFSNETPTRESAGEVKVEEWRLGELVLGGVLVALRSSWPWSGLVERGGHKYTRTVDRHTSLVKFRCEHSRPLCSSLTTRRSSD
jgi:hypothetical protein